MPAAQQSGVLHSSDEEQATCFFQAVLDAFQSAARSTGIVERYYRIARATVCLRFAGDSLVPSMTPALAHLATQPGSQIDLTVCLWDSASTGIKMPSSPWRTHFGTRGEVQGHNTQRISTVYHHESGGVSMLDRAANMGIFWVPDVERIPYWEKGAPLRAILHWWMGQKGYQMVHAAAVGTTHGGVLLAGKGGSGKSTAALACLTAGMLYAGDDYATVSANPSPFVHSVYNTAKLAGHQVGIFPHLAADISNPDRVGDEKALLYVNGCYSKQLSSGFELRAILLPQITGLPETRLKKASAASALMALAPSTIFQLPRAGQHEFRQVASLIKSLPCYVLECGTDIAGIPGVIADVLARSHR